MDRRNFINASLISGVGYSLVGNSTIWANLLNSCQDSLIKKGDTIGLICPGSSISHEQLQLAIKQLKNFGLIPYLGQHVSEKSGYLGGTDQQRVDDLHDMYSNKKVKAIWAIRGGYGNGRLLPLIDFDLIRKNAKPLIGYSDLTIPLNIIFQKTGIVNYHFIMPGALIDDFCSQQFKQHFCQTKNSIYSLKEPIVNKNHLHANGTLLGGNLTVLCSLIGTPYEINFDHSILFLEDVGEKPYRIDRMLTQMKQAGAFEKVKGLILGQFTKCEGTMIKGMESVEDLILSFFTDLNIPIVINAPIGHVDSQWALPIGAKVNLDLENKIMKTID